MAAATEAPTTTADELAAHLRISPRWIYEQAKRRNIPCLRVGRFIRFTDEHVAEIKAQLEQAAKPPAPVYGLSARSRHRRRSP